MKKTLLIFLVCVSVRNLTAQNPIFNGGNGDGYAANGVSETSNNIFNGGIADGYATTTLIINLPVRFEYFKANAVSKGVMLTWQTSSEQLSDRFEIERSVDGLNFEKLGVVKSKGQSSIMTSYTFLDTRPLRNHNYYRLKQIDKNSDFVYTPVEMVVFEGEINLLTLYPQPAKTFVVLELPSSFQGKKVTINFVNASGMLMKQIITKDNFAGNKIQVPLHDLGAGTYVVQAISGESSFRTKLIMQ